MRYSIFAVIAALALIGAGCSDAQTGPPISYSEAGQPLDDAGNPISPDGGAASDGAAVGCQEGQRSCVDSEHRRVCRLVGAEGRWVDEACPTHSYCLDGTGCRPACVDECVLGQTRSAAGQTETCRLVDAAQDKAIATGSGLHDRARRHHARMQGHQLPNGYVASVRYKDATRTKPLVYHGTADSALWTGAYLAAEALRLKATGAPDARRSVEQLVESVHRLFQVTGHPGYFARFFGPIGKDPAIDPLHTPEVADDHVVDFAGEKVFWKGNTSRDQYAGVVLGYSLAYDALSELSSAKHRKLIRDDIVALVTELLRDRKQQPVTVRYRFAGKWHEAELSFDLKYVVLNPSEFVKGKPFVQVGSSSDGSDYGASKMLGLREFFPDFSLMLKQVPLLGALIPSVPRSGTAVMLANILRVALQVTEGQPAHAATHAMVKSHYDQEIAGWLALMKQYAYHGGDCWKSYFALNIVFGPLYNLIRLEPDPTLKAALQKDVLVGRLWPYVDDHKNVFFSYIVANQGTPGAIDQGLLDAMKAQLDQFPPPPKLQVAIDNTGKYPASSKCAGQTAVAVDVKDRRRDGFIWERDPFVMTSPGDQRVVYPAVDYLLAYWMGREGGLLADDAAPGACLRWRGQ